ncbi:MAG TPA: squalene/phytoene synthase family protein [Candidatus Dormibacteraeota bacterium]|nr:squalene/phytoene synthase family protein [Candidatus Dormibacteraeota bacterium]
MKREAKSFFLATRLLPRAKRQAVEAVYGLFRTVDDVADEGNATGDERRRKLDAIALTVERIRDPGHEADDAWFPAVRDAFASFPIQSKDALRLIAACRAEVDGVVCDTPEALEAYCAAVAGTVGRCAMAILGAGDADALDRAERLGIALQLTNILRDLGKDREIGRNYLPGVLSSDDVIARARTYYKEAGILARRLPDLGSRLAVIAAAKLYERKLTRLRI